VNNELKKIWKVGGMAYLGYYSGVEGLRKTIKYLHKGNQYLGQNSNPQLPGYEVQCHPFNLSLVNSSMTVVTVKKCKSVEHLSSQKLNFHAVYYTLT
jgi:hypothetical protein